MGKFKKVMQNGIVLTLFVLGLITGLVVWALALMGLHQLYGLGGLLFGIFIPIAGPAFPILLWMKTGIIWWFYIGLFFLQFAFWIPFSILAKRMKE